MADSDRMAERGGDRGADRVTDRAVDRGADRVSDRERALDRGGDHRTGENRGGDTRGDVRTPERPTEKPVREETKHVTVIGADIQIRGELTFERSMRLDGKFEGKINGGDELFVSEGSVCKAEVSVANLVIDGLVQGNCNATERIQLNSKAKIHGDVVAPRLIVADGASFVGNVTIGEDSIKSVGKSTMTSTGAPPPRPSLSPVGAGHR